MTRKNHNRQLSNGGGRQTQPRRVLNNRRFFRRSESSLAISNGPSKVQLWADIGKRGGVKLPTSILNTQSFINQKLSEGYIRKGNRLVKRNRNSRSEITIKNGRISQIKIDKKSKKFNATYADGFMSQYVAKDNQGRITGDTEINFNTGAGTRTRIRSGIKKTTKWDFKSGTSTVEKKFRSADGPTTIQKIRAEQSRAAEIRRAQNELKKQIGLGQTTLSLTRKLGTGETVTVSRDGKITVRNKDNELVSREVKPIKFKQRPLNKQELAIGRRFDKKSKSQFSRILQLRQPKLAALEVRIAIADRNISKAVATKKRRKLAKEKGVLVVTVDRLGRQTAIRSKDLLGLGISPLQFISRVKQKHVNNVARGSISIPNPKTFKQKALGALSKLGITVRADKLEEIRANLQEGAKTKPKDLAIMLLLVSVSAINSGIAIQKEGRVKKDLALANIAAEGISVKNARNLFRGTSTEIAGIVTKNAPFIPFLGGVGAAAGTVARFRVGRTLLKAAAPFLGINNVIGIVETYKEEGLVSAVTQEIIEDAAIISGAKVSNARVGKLLNKLKGGKVEFKSKNFKKEVGKLPAKDANAIKRLVTKANKSLEGVDQKALSKSFKKIKASHRLTYLNLQSKRGLKREIGKLKLKKSTIRSKGLVVGTTINSARELRQQVELIKNRIASLPMKTKRKFKKEISSIMRGLAGLASLKADQIGTLPKKVRKLRSGIKRILPKTVGQVKYSAARGAALFKEVKATLSASTYQKLELSKLKLKVKLLEKHLKIKEISDAVKTKIKLWLLRAFSVLDGILSVPKLTKTKISAFAKKITGMLKSSNQFLKAIPKKSKATVAFNRRRTDELLKELRVRSGIKRILPKTVGQVKYSAARGTALFKEVKATLSASTYQKLELSKLKLKVKLLEKHLKIKDVSNSIKIKIKVLLFNALGLLGDILNVPKYTLAKLSVFKKRIKTFLKKSEGMIKFNQLRAETLSNEVKTRLSSKIRTNYQKLSNEASRIVKKIKFNGPSSRSRFNSLRFRVKRAISLKELTKKELRKLGEDISLLRSQVNSMKKSSSKSTSQKEKTIITILNTGKVVVQKPSSKAINSGSATGVRITAGGTQEQGARKQKTLLVFKQKIDQIDASAKKAKSVSRLKSLSKNTIKLKKEIFISGLNMKIKGRLRSTADRVSLKINTSILSLQNPKTKASLDLRRAQKLKQLQKQKLKQKQDLKRKISLRLKAQQIKMPITPAKFPDLDEKKKVKILTKLTEKALKKDNIYIPDLYSRLYNIKIDPKLRKQFTQKGALFSGVGIRKLL